MPSTPISSMAVSRQPELDQDATVESEDSSAVIFSIPEVLDYVRSLTDCWRDDASSSRGDLRSDEIFDRLREEHQILLLPEEDNM
ncbi:unnamed protein product [Arabis nemorensis]|uniref:Uncharacterized protein n=1 Tax=Arabis nemorensis TaxID=586526 RepID=A0A565BGV9_9BRAS|nr:unnamed protein product [Arabis nemorensis]